MSNPTNIIIKHQQGEVPSVWLSESYLLELLPSLSKTYLAVKARPVYKASVQPCFRDKTYLPYTGKAWRYAKVNGSFYYEYDSIPDKEPSRYASQLPSRRELIELSKQTKEVEAINPLESFIKPYLNEHYKTYLQHYGDCTQQQQINLSKAAAFIEGCTAFYIQCNKKEKPTQFFKQVAAIANTEDIRYIPKHHRNIQQVITASLECGGENIASIIKLPRANNQNAVQHCNDEELKSWIITMRYDGKNFTAEHIIRKLQWLCLVSDKPVPSRRWIGEVMEEANTKFLTDAGRFGAKGRFGSRNRGYTPFKGAVNAGDCWQIDGSRFNIIDFKLHVDKDGKIESKQVFLYIVAVRDVYSGEILGHSFNYSENRWTVLNALSIAVETAGYLPYEMVFDRFPGHNTPEAQAFFADLENRGVKVTITHKAEGKPQIERWFRTLQEVFMMGSDYYYGEGIQSRHKSAHRSKEYLKFARAKAKQEGWDFDAACDEANRIIHSYNTTALNTYSRKYSSIDKSPEQLHDESEKPNVIGFAKHEHAYLFGIRKELRMNSGLITFEMQGVTFNYRCANYDVYSQYNRVEICYNLDDMRSIHLYEISDKAVRKYLGTADDIGDIVQFGPNAFDGYGKEQAILKQMEDFKAQEREFKIAVGYDSMSILQAGEIPKHDFEEIDRQATLKLIMNDDSGDIINDDIRNQY